MFQQNTSVILIVDDNIGNLHLLVEVLKTLGKYEIRVAKNGTSALEMVQMESPDLIILEIMLPDINGFEVCTRLKADPATRDIPIIFLTVLADRINRIRGLKLGAADYITKPIIVEDVLNRVHTQLTMSRLRHTEKEMAQMKRRLNHFIEHEMETAFHTMLTASQYLRKFQARLTDDEKARQFDLIDTNAMKLIRSVKDLQSYCQMETEPKGLNLKKTALSTLFQHVDTLCQSVIKGAHTIEYGCENGLYAPIDWDVLTEAIFRLIKSTTKYAFPGSTIQVTAHQEPSAVCIRVSDKGIGIYESEQKAIFDPFYRGSNVGKIEGMGLNLTIVRHLIQWHCGTITVKSEPGKGTCFEIRLPLSDENDKVQ